MKFEHLPFWSFFHEIEKALSYERWIDKYELFLQALSGQHIIYDKDYNNFIFFCKALYLQDHRDEEMFEKLLRNAIVREQEWLLSHFSKNIAGPSTISPTGKEPKNEDQNNDKKIPATNLASTDYRRESEKEPDTSYEQNNTEESKSMYYLPPFEKISGEATTDASAHAYNFLVTDEYFPVTRRQMVKSWQFLRYKEKGGKETGLDLMATITQIARDGMFLEPQYNTGLRNREDAIIIFADYRGSMTAFHELTNRLIETARGEGGHPRAPVFYFQNYPAGFVYKNSNLTEPVKIKEALIKTNRNFTLAIIISDAGAARGTTDPEAKKVRLKLTEFMLGHLSDSCARTIWLNPMPEHRWKNTAAELIRKKVFLMAPILERGTYNFQDTLRTIVKQNLKKEKSLK